MITISIADYSYNRGVGELAKLIEKKLKVMQEHNAIYVSWFYNILFNSYLYQGYHYS